tara:strand:- start:3360 stop:4523 length:1164 start_codon:yes stop_codon:yes gene_type:complete
VNSEKLLNEIISWYPKKELPININEPLISSSDIDAVIKTLDDNWVSTAGPIVNEFEKSISKVFDGIESVAVNSGTSALHLAIQSLDISNEDQIITTPLTFVAPLNAIKYVGAEPLFIDISLEDLSIDLDLLEEYANKFFDYKNGMVFDKNTERTVKAVLVVDVFGTIGKIKEYRKFCDKFELKLIVDSAESLGSKRNDHTSAKYSDITTTSFNGNKIVTSGSGGAIISKDKELLNKIRHLSTTANIASDKYSYFHDSVGFNYRLAALNASLGNSQIKLIEQKVNLYRKIHENYSNLVDSSEGIKIFKEPKGSYSNYWLNLFILDDKISNNDKESLLLNLNKEGIGSRNVWSPLYDLPYVKKNNNLKYPNTELIYSQGFNLASTPKIL